MYKGEADWNLIADVKNNPRMKIPVFANGDINSPERAKEIRDRYGLDGAMIGRAAIGYPWIFKEIKHFFETGSYLKKPTMKERIETCKKHLIHSIDWKGPLLGIAEMKRHYTNYFKGIPDFKQYRMKLMLSETSDEVLESLNEIDNKVDHIFI